MNKYIQKAYKAVAQIRTHDDKQIIGYIEFNEINGLTYIIGELNGLSVGYHGMHIHEKGDPRKCCSALGDHYNPFNKNHGNITDIDRHVGDLGNIIVDENGKCLISLADNQIKVTGPYSIIGRSIIIHENKDDLGKGLNLDSIKTGNSGKRIAYGIIGYA